MENKKTSRTNHPGLFTKDGRNGKTYEKWTEDACHELLDRLEQWYAENDTNIYFKEFVLREGLYQDIIDHITSKFESVSKRFKYFNDLQEQRLVSLATIGVTKEGFTKFMLINKFGYAEKTEVKSENTNNNTITWNESKSYESE